LGTVKATSALPFDIGVYLVVLGLVLMAFEAFGDDLDDELRSVEARAAREQSAALEQWDAEAPR
jgi:hypothetical protein